jgi:hypothetical protein
MKPVYPATIRFSDLKVFVPGSILNILHDSDLNVFDTEHTDSRFKLYADKLYLPTLKFILSQEIKTNLILTGDFLDQSTKICPEIIELIRALLEKELIKIVADTYWGENLTCLYNPYWWSQSLLKTTQKIEQIFAKTTKIAFLPQLYRSLELERVCHHSQIHTFILKQEGKKQFSFQTKLSEFRRFNGENVYWIEKDADTLCTFHYIPETSFFQINGNIFQPDIKAAAKTFAMAVGFTSADFVVKSQTKRIRTTKKPLRINEKPSLSGYNTMERAVVRLWEYGLVLLMNELNYQPRPKLQKMFDEFCAMQNSEFLFYLNKSIYLSGVVENFSSPFEAFASVQARIKQIEIIIKEK